jgi:hypothetical protein
LKQNGPKANVQQLDLEGFIEFMLQLGYFLYKPISDIPITFMGMLFDRLRVASQNFAPMF